MMVVFADWCVALAQGIIDSTGTEAMAAFFHIFEKAKILLRVGHPVLNNAQDVAATPVVIYAE